jgi:tRNA 2-thiouridine synthesizing protein E
VNKHKNNSETSIHNPESEKFITIDDQSIELDKEGFLRNLSDWNHGIAKNIAINEHINLSAAHWEIIDLLRTFYKQHQLSPASRALVSLVKRELGANKGKSAYLMKLFRGSPAKTANKIAGLPKPDNCL